MRGTTCPSNRPSADRATVPVARLFAGLYARDDDRLQLDLEVLHLVLGFGEARFQVQIPHLYGKRTNRWEEVTFRG